MRRYERSAEPRCASPPTTSGWPTTSSRPRPCRARIRGAASPDLDGSIAVACVLLAPPAHRRRRAPRRLDALHVVVCHPAGAPQGRLTAARCAGGSKKTGTTQHGDGALADRPARDGSWAACAATCAPRRSRWSALMLPVPSTPSSPSGAAIDRALAPAMIVRGKASPPVVAGCAAPAWRAAPTTARIVRSFPGAGRLPCTTITAREADGGSPVYPEPAANGA